VKSDIIRTVYLEGRVATIERHREKLDRRTGLSRQIRSRYPTAVRSAKEARTISHRSFGDRGFNMQRTMTTKTPKLRYAISRFDRSRKSSRDLDRSFRWTRGSQETSSAIQGSGVHMSKFLDIENPEIAICDFAI
jgi:hypothetical protein